MDCSPQVSSVHGSFLRRILLVGCHFLLQGIVLIQGSNLGLLRLLHCRQILYNFLLQGIVLIQGSNLGLLRLLYCRQILYS